MSELPGTGGERSDDRLIGQRYRLLAPLGQGGMGTVWRARDEVLHREVAVKEVRAPAGLPEAEVERLYARLEREAWAAARISHRSVVTVYDVAVAGGRPWIVMELVRGVSLADALDAEGPMPPQRAARIAADVLAALRAAHEAGVLHRDVKPANVLLSNDGRVVLTDFGIALVAGSSTLTITGEVVGSPEFLAPERALGRTPGPESDLWSLGVLLYAAVEGHTPFRQDTPLSTLRAVVDEELPPPRRAGPLAPVIEGLLRKDPAQRLGAADAEAELRIVGAGGPPREARTPQPAPYPPTVTAQQPTQTGPGRPPGPAFGPPAQAASPSAGAGPAPRPGQGRRTALLLIAALAALALIVAGIAYALGNRGGENGGGAQGGGATGEQPGGGADSGTGDGGATGDGNGNGSGGDGNQSGSEGNQNGKSEGNQNEGNQNGGGDGGGGTTRPPQTVHVTLTAIRDGYEGWCPPPAGAAPEFRATFTVGRTPVTLTYHWVTAKGESSDPGPQTLSFPAGGGRTRHVQHTETGYVPGATLDNQLRVTVREPVSARSGTVTYRISCKQTSPPPDGGDGGTDGGTYGGTDAAVTLRRRR